jgi:Tfp pilus assembly protein PilO
VKVEMRGGSRRALIFLIAALAIYGLANWVVLPAYDRLAAAGDLASEKETQLKRYRRAELRKGQYADLLKLAGDRITKTESVVISAANLSLASAELQSMIEGGANKLGLTVGQRSMGVPRRLNDFFAEIPMTLSFDSTPGQLVSFLSELQSLPRYVTVRVIQVSPVMPVFETPKGIDLTKNVHVNMTVSALCPADLVKQDRVTR